MSILTKSEPQGPHSKVDFENRSWSAQSWRLLNDFQCSSCLDSGLDAILNVSVLADAIQCRCGSWTNVAALRASRAMPTKVERRADDFRGRR